MAGASGYVHISKRGRDGEERTMRPVPGTGGMDTPRRPLRSLSGAGPQGGEQAASSGNRGRPQGEHEARGFVLYVGLNEDLAADSGTSLVQMVQGIRSYATTLVPEAQTYAAVAIAPTGTEGSDLDVVRDALGDPTSAKHQSQQSEHQPLGGDRRSETQGVLVDLSRREVLLDGQLLNLTYKEFELLSFLVENAHRTVRREELLESLWSGADEVPHERTIDVHVRRLRSKLGRLASTVRTVRGQGYRFYEHPEVTVWAAPEYSI